MIFEIIMLLCFGVSWPVAILKTLRSKTVKGLSPLFLTLILTGYISGSIYKWFYNFDRVIFLYILNGIFVAVQLFLYFRFREK